MILKELKISTWVGDPTNCYIIFDEESQETIQKNRKIISFAKKYNNIEQESIPIYNFD